jgi:hypothetical protein
VLLERRSAAAKPRLDIAGVLAVSGAVFCLVYGFSNAATHSWRTPSTYGFIAAGVALLALFAFRQARGGAYASMLIASAGMFGTFLFLPYYLQQTLGYSVR